MRQCPCGAALLRRVNGQKGRRLMRFPMALALGLSTVMIAAGCASTPRSPRGDTGGSADPYRSTDADRYARRVSTVSLLEFSDQVSDAIARRIARVQEIVERDGSVLILMGNLKNDTATPSNDFEIIQRRVFTGLVNNDFVAAHADVIEAPEGLDAQYRRLAPDGYGDRTARYDPEDEYLLQGFFGEMERGNASQSTYYFEMTLTNLASGRIVFSEQLDQKQIRSSY